MLCNATVRVDTAGDKKRNSTIDQTISLRSNCVLWRMRFCLQDDFLWVRFRGGSALVIIITITKWHFSFMHHTQVKLISPSVKKELLFFFPDPDISINPTRIEKQTLKELNYNEKVDQGVRNKRYSAVKHRTAVTKRYNVEYFSWQCYVNTHTHTHTNTHTHN